MKTRRCEVCGTVFTVPGKDDPEERPNLCPLCKEVTERDDDS